MQKRPSPSGLPETSRLYSDRAFAKILTFLKENGLEAHMDIKGNVSLKRASPKRARNRAAVEREG